MRVCEVCGCPEADEDGRATHSQSFCWFGPACEVRHPFTWSESRSEVDLRAQVHNPR